MNDEEPRAVGVRVTNFSDMVFRTEETEPEHFSFSTVTLTPGQNPLDNQILAHDPMRKAASIVSNDAPIILCNSPAQAASPANQVSGFPAPDGAYIAQGAAVAVTGTGAAWAACQAPTRVTLILNRRSALWLICNSAVPRAG